MKNTYSKFYGRTSICLNFLAWSRKEKKMWLKIQTEGKLKSWHKSWRLVYIFTVESCNYPIFHWVLHLPFYILNSLESNLTWMGWNLTLPSWHNVTTLVRVRAPPLEEWYIHYFLRMIHWPLFKWRIITSEKVSLSNSTVFEINLRFILQF